MNQYTGGYTVGSITNLSDSIDYSIEKNLTYQSVKVITDETIIPLSKIGGQKYMETIYEVIVVDKYRSILMDEKVVAATEEKAKFNIGVYKLLEQSEMTLDEVTVITRVIGHVVVDKDLA